jgi:hypothetical protein
MQVVQAMLMIKMMETKVEIDIELAGVLCWPTTTGVSASGGHHPRRGSTAGNQKSHRAHEFRHALSRNQDATERKRRRQPRWSFLPGRKGRERVPSCPQPFAIVTASISLAHGQKSLATPVVVVRRSEYTHSLAVSAEVSMR